MAKKKTERKEGRKGGRCRENGGKKTALWPPNLDKWMRTAALEPVHS